ncbi:hypothetical protein, partial [Gluconobacter oxydans]
LDGSHLCGNGSTGSAILINSGGSKARITNNTISKACDGQTSNSTVGLNLSGNNAAIIATGNDFTGLDTPIATGGTNTSPGYEMVIN